MYAIRSYYEHQSLREGNSTERSNLRINDKIKSEQEQIEIIENKAEDNSSAFLISQEDIDAVLQRGSGVVHGKFRIFKQFKKQLSMSENASFLV